MEKKSKEYVKNMHQQMVARALPRSAEAVGERAPVVTASMRLREATGGTFLNRVPRYRPEHARSMPNGFREWREAFDEFMRLGHADVLLFQQMRKSRLVA